MAMPNSSMAMRSTDLIPIPSKDPNWSPFLWCTGWCFTILRRLSQANYLVMRFFEGEKFLPGLSMLTSGSGFYFLWDFGFCSGGGNQASYLPLSCWRGLLWCSIQIIK